MEKLVKGDVVVVPFPFSDLTNAKRRPALVIAPLRGDDVILCQITSKEVRDEYALRIKESDFAKGSLHMESNVRPNRLFTADRNIVSYQIGRLKQEKISQVIENVVAIIKNDQIK